jgi:hypothetical protein
MVEDFLLSPKNGRRAGELGGMSELDAEDT